MEEKYQSTEHSIDLKELHDFIRQHGEAVDYRRGETIQPLPIRMTTEEPVVITKKSLSIGNKATFKRKFR